MAKEAYVWPFYLTISLFVKNAIYAPYVRDFFQDSVGISPSDTSVHKYDEGILGNLRGFRFIYLVQCNLNKWHLLILSCCIILVFSWKNTHMSFIKCNLLYIIKDSQLKLTMLAYDDRNMLLEKGHNSCSSIYRIMPLFNLNIVSDFACSLLGVLFQ